MKKTVITMLCIIMLLLSACGAGRQAPDLAFPVEAAATPVPLESTPEPTAAADAESEAAAIVDAAVKIVPAYGEERRIEADQGGFAGTISYPSGFEPLDIALESWANKTIKAYEKKGLAETADAEGTKAELFVNYNSYELNGRFVGVKETGAYYVPASGKTEMILFTANYDSETEKMLPLNNVIGKTHQDAVAVLLTEKLREEGNIGLLGDEKMVTAERMQNVVITDSGLLFLFTDGEAGYGECLLSYEAIANYIVFLAPDADPAAAATPAPVEKPAVVEEVRCNTGGVHVRAAASTDAATLAVIQENAMVEVTKQDAGNGFTEIWYNEGLAYVKTAYLDVSASSVPKSDKPETETGYVTGSGVHVRADATTHSKKLGTLKYGEEVQVVTAYYTDNWHQILFNDRIAYISAQYVRIGDKPAVTPKPTEIEPESVHGRPHIQFVGTCTADGVIIRAKASTHSDYYGKLYEDDEVHVVEAEYRSGWDKVWIPTNHSHSKGYIGYVHSKYIADLSVVVPVVQATVNPVIPVVQVTPTPIPVITTNPVWTGPGPAIGSGAGVPAIGSGVTVPAIGSGVTVP